MAELFDTFPYLENDRIIIKKMLPSDVDELTKLGNSDNVYKYIPPMLYKKSRKLYELAIKNIGERDFLKKKQIIAGVYLKSNPGKLIGLAEMFHYLRRTNEITIGYRLQEDYWNQGIATSVVRLMKEYLIKEIGIAKLNAFVMPENIYSEKVLLKNGFIKEDKTIEETNWGGRPIVTLNGYTFTKEMVE